MKTNASILLFSFLVLFTSSCKDEEYDCSITDLQVSVGECNNGETYELTIDFNFDNPENDYFEVYVRDNQLLGYYLLSDLPLTIPDFEISGSENDYIRICINDNEDCCNEIEWDPPQCTENDCSITDLQVSVGECNNGETYELTIDFNFDNPENDYFEVYVRDNQLLGYYLLSDLPLTIPDFEISGSENDYIRICINDNEDCCNEIEWDPPQC